MVQLTSRKSNNSSGSNSARILDHSTQQLQSFTPGNESLKPFSKQSPNTGSDLQFFPSFNSLSNQINKPPSQSYPQLWNRSAFSSSTYSELQEQLSQQPPNQSEKLHEQSSEEASEQASGQASEQEQKTSSQQQSVHLCEQLTNQCSEQLPTYQEELLLEALNEEKSEEQYDPSSESFDVEPSEEVIDLTSQQSHEMPNPSQPLQPSLVSGPLLPTETTEPLINSLVEAITINSNWPAIISFESTHFRNGDDNNIIEPNYDNTRNIINMLDMLRYEVANNPVIQSHQKFLNYEVCGALLLESFNGHDNSMVDNVCTTIVSSGRKHGTVLKLVRRVDKRK